MERLCHVFRIAPGTEVEYVRRHVEIWPEMVEAMDARASRTTRSSAAGSNVIAYCECEPDVETCFARFADDRVGERWQASMEGMVLGLTDANGELVAYEEDWHLD
jgi:L-rhamnose mutarotase